MRASIIAVACVMLLVRMPRECIAQEARPRLVAQVGHCSGTVFGVASSSDGKLLATGGGDGTACLWEVATGREIRAFHGHFGSISTVALSSDDKWLVTASSDHTARLWDVATGKEIRAFRGHEGDIGSIALSGDKRWLITCSGIDGSVRLWEVATGKLTRVFKSKDGVSNATLSRDGKWLATATIDKQYVAFVRLWDVETGKPVRDFEKKHTSYIFSLAFSDDGAWIVTAGFDQIACLWDVATGKELRRFRGHEKGLHGATISADRKWVATSSYDKTARLWNAGTGKQVHLLKGHTEIVTCVSFTQDGKHLFTGCCDQTARLWDAATGEERRVFRGHSGFPRASVFSGDGKWIITHNGKTAELWDLATGKLFRRFPKGEAHTWALSRDGKRLVMGGTKIAKLIDTTTGDTIRTFVGHTNNVTRSTLSDDGKWLVTASDDKSVRLWDLATGKHERSFDAEAFHMTLSHDAKWLITCGLNEVKFWEVATGKVIRRLPGNTNGEMQAVFSADDKLLATSNNTLIGLWDPATGKLIRTLEPNPTYVSFMAFSPDGRRLITGGADDRWDHRPISEFNTLRWWEVATGLECHRFKHSPRINFVGLSPNGKHLFSSYSDHALGVWDAFTCKELCRLVCFRNESWGVFDSDGRFDAANDGNCERLHWVLGNETLPLRRFRDRGYDPGLLAKHLGFHKEAPRKQLPPNEPRP